MEILKPYIACYIGMHKLPDDQKAILYLDCYPVHIGQEFLHYVFEEFPNIFLVFVPANCELWSIHFAALVDKHFAGTGIFQPADVGLQHIAKQFLCQRALEFLVDSHTEQIKQGLTPDAVKFTTSLPVLHNASVWPIVKLFNFSLGFWWSRNHQKGVLFSDFQAHSSRLTLIEIPGMGKVYSEIMESRSEERRVGKECA